MPRTVEVYLEQGRRRVFAGAIEWPGWCRSGKDEKAALEALLAYAPRYAKAVKRAAPRFAPPAKLDELVVAERLKGDATTDFGAPGIAPRADARPVGARELERLTKLLDATWAALDAAARKAAGVVLTKGPRGGGRELDAIVAHVAEADAAYLRSLGGRFRGDAAGETHRLRREMRDTLAARASGEPPAPSRRRRPPWTPRYAIRRSAWHALDHAWEIEDRSNGPIRAG